ncbi:hypothetical protein [Onishia niordana]|uniref:hypothetical protein n=1 Tax=Onishia niordana TaxID=2508711 RepID=UPI001446626C|nr:hypothetical protein [Halomonas niordiana]
MPAELKHPAQRGEHRGLTVGDETREKQDERQGRWEVDEKNAGITDGQLNPA